MRLLRESGRMRKPTVFLWKAQAIGREVGRAIIERNHPGLSVGAQCRLLSIFRSSFWNEVQGESATNLDLMLLIDTQFPDTPFHGVRQMTRHLRNDGHPVNGRRIRRLMRLMSLMPICQKPNTGKPAKGHKTHPYLRCGLQVAQANQVRCADITHIPLRRGFLCLLAMVDWHGRKVSAWRISNTPEAAFCVGALNAAIHRFCPTAIMNTVRGSPFTFYASIDWLKRAGIRILTDGKGRGTDDVFIKRLWRSMKCEGVCLRARETGPQAKSGIGNRIIFHNPSRPHSSPGGTPPAVFLRRIIAETQTDQQLQKAARKTPETVRTAAGSSQLADAGLAGRE